MSIRDDLAGVLAHARSTWQPSWESIPGHSAATPTLDTHMADAVLAYLMSADKPWVLGSEPHMDGSHTVSVAKYDGRPGTVTVRVPAGYVLAKVWP